MRHTTRTGIVVAVGAIVGFAVGFLVWGRRGVGRRFAREYADGHPGWVKSLAVSPDDDDLPGREWGCAA